MSININQYLILVVLGLFTGMVNAFPNNDNTSLIEVAKQESTSVQSSFEIVNPLIDMCLSPKNKLSKLGAKVTFETCDNNEKQQWTLNKSDKVIHKGSQKCLATLGDDPTLTLWSCNARKSLHRGRVNFVTFPDQDESVNHTAQTRCKKYIAVSYKAQSFDFECKSDDQSSNWLVRAPRYN